MLSVLMEVLTYECELFVHLYKPDINVSNICVFHSDKFSFDKLICILLTLSDTNCGNNEPNYVHFIDVRISFVECCWCWSHFVDRILYRTMADIQLVWYLFWIFRMMEQFTGLLILFGFFVISNIVWIAEWRKNRNEKTKD